MLSIIFKVIFVYGWFVVSETFLLRPSRRLLGTTCIVRNLRSGRGRGPRSFECVTASHENPGLDACSRLIFINHFGGCWRYVAVAAEGAVPWYGTISYLFVCSYYSIT